MRKFTYLVENFGAGSGYGVAMTARRKFGWVIFIEFCELLYGKKLSKGEGCCLQWLCNVGNFIWE